MENKVTTSAAENKPENNEADKLLETFTSTAPAPLTPEDILAFSISDDEEYAGESQKLLGSVTVDKPHKSSWVRTHPDADCRKRFALYEDEDTGNVYLLTDAMRHWCLENLGGGESIVKDVLLVLTVDRRGNCRLWPITLSDRDLAWYSSAKRAADLAKDRWIRITANMSAKCYDIFEAADQDAKPVWPKESYGEILLLAFPDRVISSPDHEVLVDLKGKQLAAGAKL